MALEIAILASGSGTNAQAIIDKSKSGALDVDVKLVFSNRPGAPVLEKARKAGIPITALDHRDFIDRRLFDAELARRILAHGCQFVVLAGYMRLLTQEFLNWFKDSVVNIHPALLPSFPGIHGAADALAYGVKISGVSVHFVEEKMDSGPIIIQAAVPVMPEDSAESLQNRIHAMEYRIYPQALQWLAEGRVSRRGRMVVVEKSAKKKVEQGADWFVWPPLEEGF